MSLNPSEKIKVLQVFDKIGMKGSPIHGATRVLMSWWPEFEKTKYELSLVVLKKRSEGSILLEHEGINAEYIDKSKFDPRIIYDLMENVRRNKIQLLHCHGYAATNFGRIVGIICKIPVVAHEHMIDKHMPTYQKIADRLLSRFASKSIAVSKSVKNFMVEERYLEANKTSIIYNGIPKSYIRTYDRSEISIIANKTKIPLDVPIVGIVGRLNPVKRHVDYIDAAKLVLQDYPDVCFLVIGEGDLRNELKNQADKLKISESILFLGHCENVLEVISLLDVLVLCSYSEGCPVSILEGMALSKAIVATSVGGIPELINDGVTGLLVPPKSPKALAQSIKKILNNDELKQKLGDNALLSCKEKFLVTHTVNQLHSMYSGLLD